MKKLKILLIILLIILVSMISFIGIYVQDKKAMNNVLANYKLGMDLRGARNVTTVVNKENKTIYYDKDGKVVTAEAEGGKKEEVPINKEENLTKENYIRTKEIIEKRLREFGVSEYLIRQDENTGKLTVQVSEDSNTDLAIQYIYTVGKFTVVGENDEVLLDNSNIKDVSVNYNTTEKGTTVYLNIKFNKDCIEKLKDISNQYVKTTDAEGKETTKQVTIKLDDSNLISTSFDEEIANGTLSIAVGNATTDNTAINSYLKEASNLAILLNNGEFPVSYTMEQNRYVVSDITIKDIVILGMIIAIVIIIATIVLTVIYKKNGFFIGIANIGYLAVLLLLIRYTNVIITVEGIFGILTATALNYIFSIYLLKTIKKNEEDIKIAYNKTVVAMLFVLIPALIIGITLCFANWMPIYSFGAITFWGILMILIYNTVLTRTLLICGRTK